MSKYSNTSGNHDGYVDAVLALVGDEDPLKILARTPTEFVTAVSSLSAEALRAPERPGAWSIADVLRHMADSDLMWGVRLRRVLTEDAPILRGYDQDRWRDRLSYDRFDPRDSIELFRVLRRENLRVVDGAGADGRRRVGRHEERGEETVEHMLKLYAGHDLVHVRQVDRIRRAVTT